MDDFLVGSTFGRWTVVWPSGRKCVVVCQCGAQSKALRFDLKSGKSTMCRSCSYKLRIGVSNAACIRHGLSGGYMQTVWSDMKRRCYSAHRADYPRYGGRGIRVCDRWVLGEGAMSGLECFAADMGERPSEAHQLERKDNNGDYEPSNCVWAHRSQQDYNKRNTFLVFAQGKQLNLAEASKIAGIPKSVIWRRVRCGMSHDEACTRPVRQTRRSA
jgi:hypothetical protein